MPFEKTVETQRYVPSPPPTLPGSESLHYKREIEKLAMIVGKLHDAVKEMQDYLEANT